MGPNIPPRQPIHVHLYFKDTENAHIGDLTGNMTQSTNVSPQSDSLLHSTLSALTNLVWSNSNSTLPNPQTSLTVHCQGSITGNVNVGTGRIECNSDITGNVTTYGGDIICHGDVRATTIKTGCGDITCSEPVQCSTITTTTGDISIGKIIVTEDDTTVETLNGDVEIHTVNTAKHSVLRKRVRIDENQNTEIPSAKRHKPNDDESSSSAIDADESSSDSFSGE
jgi:hypothetical protein